MTAARPRAGGAVVEPTAVAGGAIVAVAVCLPLALLSRAVAEGEGSAVTALLFLGVLAGFAAGGAVAARAAGAAPFTNGALAALLAFAAVQGTALVVRLVTGGDAPSIPAIAFDGLLAYGCGVAGSVLATRRRPRRGTPA